MKEYILDVVNNDGTNMPGKKLSNARTRSIGKFYPRGNAKKSVMRNGPSSKKFSANAPSPKKPLNSGAYPKKFSGGRYALKRAVAPKKINWAARSKGKMDVTVKKTAYSKAARLAVLASAVTRQRLIEMGGENTIDIIREFDQDMSDEELAKKTGIKASDVRVVLNRLHNHGLFSYTRVRDRDSGWYSYIWKMSEARLDDFVGSVNVNEGARVETDAGREGEDVVDYLNSNSNQGADGGFYEAEGPRQRFMAKRR